MFLCVGPVGPGFEICSLQFSVKKNDSGNQYISNHILGPNNCGDIKFGLCLWALLDPYLDYVHHQRQ